MRRLMLFALASSLALSACSNDDTATGPTKCRPAPFPIYSLTLQTIKIFPVQGGLQAKALISEVAIGVLWTVCKPTDAQKGVAAFVKWMVQQFQAGDDPVAPDAVVHLRAKADDQFGDLVLKQVFFIQIVGIEGGPPDIRPVYDLLHRDRIIALLQHQRHQGIPQ